MSTSSLPRYVIPHFRVGVLLSAALLAGVSLAEAVDPFPKDTPYSGKLKKKKASTENQQSSKTTPEEELSLTQLQARMYREAGMKMQQAGDLERALSYYQKAVELDPQLAAVHNDVGVLYEAMGKTDQAEESYRKALKINPAYASAYTNLALLYESKRDLKQAGLCWQQRAQLGPAGDPWAEKAQQRLHDILWAMGEYTQESGREQDVVDLLRSIATKKELFRNDEKAQAQHYLDQAKLSYKKDDYANAMRLAVNAQLLDPTDREINEFIEKLQTRALSQ